MRTRGLTYLAIIVWCTAALVVGFVGLPALSTLGVLHLNAAVIVGALAALGPFSAAAAVFGVAISWLKRLEQDRDEDRTKAGLVWLKAHWQGLGTPEGGVRVSVKNFGKLPIVDVAVKRWEVDGQQVILYSSTPAELEAIFPGTSTDVATFVVRPMTPGWRFAIQGGAFSERGQQVLNVTSTVVEGTDTTVTIEFADAGGKRWRRSNKGLLERIH